MARFMSATFKLFEITRDYDTYARDGTQIPVVGRLKAGLGFYKHIKAPQFVINTIKHGYKLPMLTMPKSFHGLNNKSAVENQEFVRLEIDKKKSVEDYPAIEIISN